MLDFEKTYHSVPENIYEIDLLGKALNKIGLIKAQRNYDSLLANVAQAKLVPVNDDIVEARAVWELKDKDGKTIGYLKYGMMEEIQRTRLFNQIISDNNLQEKYPLLVIEYPQIIEEDIAFMDENIFKGVEDDFERIEDDVRSASSRTQLYFAMTPVDASGFVVANNIWPSEEAGVLAAQKLNGKSITEEEWQQIADFFKELNNKGFVHEDLVNNMFFKRDKEGKLHITVLDFEKVVDPINNDQNIRAMKNYFNGIKPYFIPKIFRDDQVRAKWVLSDWSGRLQPYIRWALYDGNDKVIGDLIYSTTEKIESIKKLNQIITENNLRKQFSNIDIEYPQVLTESAEGLSIPAMLRIIRDRQFLDNTILPHYFDEGNKTMFIMSPIDDSGFRWSDTKIDPKRQQGENFGHVKIDNNPITAAEWNSIFNFVVELNKNGFVCENIYDNLVFRRNEDGRLILTITDFGLGKGNTNIQEMQQLGRMLYSVGIKERNAFLDVIFSPDGM
jgi:hypothetical protein